MNQGHEQSSHTQKKEKWQEEKKKHSKIQVNGYQNRGKTFFIY